MLIPERNHVLWQLCDRALSMPCVYMCEKRVKDTHVDTSAMCLCLRVSHRSSSSSSNTSFILVSPIPLVSNLTESAREVTVCMCVSNRDKFKTFASGNEMLFQCRSTLKYLIIFMLVHSLFWFFLVLK